MRWALLLLAFSSCLLQAPRAMAYPLDGAERTGIARLRGTLSAQEATKGARLPPGALLATEDIKLSLLGVGRDWDLEESGRDPGLQAGLESILGRRDPSYAMVLIDISDPERIRWASLNEDQQQYPGSVNKTLCMVGFFDALARAFPRVSDRERLLRDTLIVADEWVQWDSHDVPHFDEIKKRNSFSPILPGQEFSMAEWIDHMVSPSANAAGAVVWREAMLLREFGAAWPVSKERADAFFVETKKSELTRLSLEVLDQALVGAGLDIGGLRQGSFWTRTGKQKVPGVRSHASPRELARLLLRLEQGRLVDSWSSLEMKRFLYLTRRRYRYVYPQELHDAAVYFKSGSFYRCKEEEGFTCRKYAGNVENRMNSIALIESPIGPGRSPRRTIVALMSNVLRKNSAADHARIAAAIERLVAGDRGRDPG